MKILITHAYSRNNKGDAAILSVMLSQLKNNINNAIISVSSMEDPTVEKLFEGYPNISSLIYYAYRNKKNRIIQLFDLIYIFNIPLLYIFILKSLHLRLHFLLTKPIQNIVDCYLESELIIAAGGGYLKAKNTLGDTIDILFKLQPFIIGKITGKTVILYPQSIGPFSNKLQKYLIKNVLNQVDLIAVREEISYKILLDIGIKKELIIKSTDAGFLFTPNDSYVKNLKFLNSFLKKDTYVGITARQWLEAKDQKKYEKVIAEFSNYLINKMNMKVILIPQVTVDQYEDDDRKVNKRIYDKIKNKKSVYLINQDLNHHEIKKIYSELQYIIGTRFHSVIFSLSSYVPALAIEYEHKTRGIMTDLGLDEWVLKIEDVSTDILIAKFNHLKNSREKYLRTLRSHLPKYIAEVKVTTKIIKKLSEKKYNKKDK